MGDRILFSADDGVHGRELWATDGTAAGTALVRNINTALDEGHPYPELGSAPRWITPVKGGVVFEAASGDDPFVSELWFSDGTEAGTYRISAVDPADLADRARPMPRAGDIALFAVDVTDPPRSELWRSDGTANGTFRLTELAPVPWALFGPVVSMGGRAFFFSWTGGESARLGLWATDGTPEGTVPLVLNLTLFGRLPLPWEVAASTSRVFFADPRLWVSDGTPEGTRLVCDGAPPDECPAAVSQLATFAGGVAFAASHPQYGCELWYSDGAASRTYLVADINPSTAACPPLAITPRIHAPYPRYEANGVLYLTHDHGDGPRMYITDGSPAGTRPLLGGPSVSCPGDCDDSGAVTVDELVRGVGIALGSIDLATCAALDGDGTGTVTIDELIAAVRMALEGCHVGSDT